MQTESVQIHLNDSVCKVWPLKPQVIFKVVVLRDLSLFLSI